MEVRTVQGYFDNGVFYQLGQQVKLPERQLVIVNILDIPVEIEDAKVDSEKTKADIENTKTDTENTTETESKRWCDIEKLESDAKLQEQKLSNTWAVKLAMGEGSKLSIRQLLSRLSRKR